MRNTRLRPFVAAAISLSAAVAGLLVAGPAQAQPVSSGSFSFSGDPGDFISLGESYSYSTGGGDLLEVFGTDNSAVGLDVSGFNGDIWSLTFDAPQGQALVPGTYTGATRFPFNGAGPGLSLFGNGRGCNQLTGEFTIINAVFGPDGYVQTFDATFEQHCEGLGPAARGEVHIANPPPPAELDLTIMVATEGTANTVNGDAEVHGTVACNKPATVDLSGTVIQIVRRVLVRGPFSTQVACTPDEPAEWTAAASPDGTTPFRRGLAEVRLQGTGFDADFGQQVTVDMTAVVRLVRFRP
jgi:hypothetical protein